MAKKFLLWLHAVYNDKHLLIELTKNDFKKKYINSALGTVWAFVQPVITVLVFWFVFAVGFKSTNVNGSTPFVIWLIIGIIPWFFFSQAVASATESIVESSYLVKQVIFRISLLPLIKIFSAAMIHLFFIVLAIVILLYQGYYPNIYWLQIPYYFLAMSVLIIGVSWLTSAITVFFRDVVHVVTIALNLGFWLTPICWSANRIPDKYRELIFLNPVSYIVEGYRNSLINNVWFWENSASTIIFWIVTVMIFVLGSLTFQKLKPYFADTL
ncbi:MAG: ABC transporter permease [Chlorobi bacterium]|nr:ABC transporter permease [Chlorobiota bacterium]